MPYINIYVYTYVFMYWYDMIFLRIFSFIYSVSSSKWKKKPTFPIHCWFFIFDEKRKIIAPLGHHFTETNCHNNTTFFLRQSDVFAMPLNLRILSVGYFGARNFNIEKKKKCQKNNKLAIGEWKISLFQKRKKKKQSSNYAWNSSDMQQIVIYMDEKKPPYFLFNFPLNISCYGYNRLMKSTNHGHWG